MATASDIEKILQETIGLDPASIGPNSIARALKQRMQTRAIRNFDSYFSLLKQSPTELQELIEEVIIPETWFFRDSGPFNALVKIVQEWLPLHPTETLRILSIPCSTGE